jgi:hypothetical protein
MKTKGLIRIIQDKLMRRQLNIYLRRLRASLSYRSTSTQLCKFQICWRHVGYVHQSVESNI